jgi:hypothetical protein
MTSRAWFRLDYHEITDCSDTSEVSSEVSSVVSSVVDHEDPISRPAVDRGRDRDRERVQMIAAAQAMMANFESADLVHNYLAKRARYYAKAPMEPIP